MDDKTRLTTTLTHEFWRCTRAFHEFAYTVSTLPEENTKLQKLECYNAYVDFLSHLYEFYIGLMKNNERHKKEVKKGSEIIDALFNAEVAKLFTNRKNRILHGYQDSMGHRIEFYECDIPTEFGKHFRFIRNRRNHADPKRADDISLKDFFDKYHKFVIILYEECRWGWQVSENEFDWKEIENFATEIVKTMPPLEKQISTESKSTTSILRFLIKRLFKNKH